MPHTSKLALTIRENARKGIQLALDSALTEQKRNPRVTQEEVKNILKEKLKTAKKELIESYRTSSKMDTPIADLKNKIDNIKEESRKIILEAQKRGSLSEKEKNELNKVDKELEMIDKELQNLRSNKEQPYDIYISKLIDLEFNNIQRSAYRFLETYYSDKIYKLPSTADFNLIIERALTSAGALPIYAALLKNEKSKDKIIERIIDVKQEGTQQLNEKEIKNLKIELSLYTPEQLLDQLILIDLLPCKDKDLTPSAISSMVKLSDDKYISNHPQEKIIEPSINPIQNLPKNPTENRSKTPSSPSHVQPHQQNAKFIKQQNRALVPSKVPAAFPPHEKL